MASQMPCPEFGTCYDPEHCQRGGSCWAAHDAANESSTTNTEERSGKGGVG